VAFGFEAVNGNATFRLNRLLRRRFVRELYAIARIARTKLIVCTNFDPRCATLQSTPAPGPFSLMRIFAGPPT